MKYGLSFPLFRSRSSTEKKLAAFKIQNSPSQIQNGKIQKLTKLFTDLLTYSVHESYGLHLTIIQNLEKTELTLY